MNKVVVLVNNEAVQDKFIQSLRVTTDIDKAVVEAELEISQNKNSSYNYLENVIYTGYESTLKTKDLITILFNDVIMFMGYVASVNANFSKENSNIATVVLKSKAQDFYESSIRGDRSFKKDITLYNLIKQMLTINNFTIIENNFELAKNNEIGVLYKVDDENIQETARLNNTTQQVFEERLSQETGIIKVKIPNVQQFYLNDTNFTFLSRIANQYNINLTSDVYGNVVLYKPKLKTKIASKLNESTITNIKVSTDESNLFYEYQVKMKTQFKSKKTNTRVKQTLSSFDFQVRETRFTVINSRDTLNGEGLQMKIDGFAGTQRARSKELILETCFLSKDLNDNTFFEAGDLIELNLKDNGAFETPIKGVFLIKAIEYMYGANEETKKILTVIEKNYFNAESLKVNN